ncbi:hypothetical protein BHM03_00016465 [Ensete ventricosum]|uniref:Uncharacterized protein n=1 Tax=Ensete ventricosum TaxID=4639 RepID=A0A445MES1_ENSVE|nr:hypothetical protein BHM03_00016465 [Ensete ventricosum]
MTSWVPLSPPRSCYASPSALPRGGHPCWWQGWLRAVAPCGRPTADPPMRAPRCKRLCPRAAATPAGSCPYGRLPPLAGVAGLRCELALAVTSRPFTGGLGRSLAVGGRPYMGLVVAGRPYMGLAVAGCPSYSLPSL